LQGKPIISLTEDVGNTEQLLK